MTKRSCRTGYSGSAPRLALAPAEQLVVYVMMTVATVLY